MEIPVLLAALVVGLAAGYLLAQLLRNRQLEQMADLLQRGLNSEAADVPDPLRLPLAELKGYLRSLATELEKSSRRHQVLMDAVEEAVILLDGHGAVVSSNLQAARLLGLNPTRTSYTLAQLLRDNEAVEFVRKSLESTHRARATFDLGTPRRPMDIQVVPIPEVGGAAVIIRDLSEMRRLERSRQELVANISHELRTPLTNIKALVETLLDGAIDDPSVSRGFLEKVEVEVDGLSQLVRELLELSLIESGQAPLEMQDTQVADIVYDVASRLHAQARRASIDLQVQIQDDIPAIKADGRRIQQVLVNLVHNAIKFTPAGGSITVGAEVRDRTVHVWVADTGIGIPDEDLPRIFERLYKVDRSRSSGGTGLGLAIAKHIVKAHGGEIWAESQQGKGSVFHFTIPITQEVSDAKGELRQGPERVAR